MKKQSIKTKWDETVIKTSDPKELLNKYLVKPLLRKWTENFIDEETGRGEEVERCEMILDAGTCLTPDNMQKVSFHQQTGDITEDILVSNLRRAGYEIISDGLTPWIANVTSNDKNCKLLLHANSAGNVLEIVNDWCSLYTESQYTITGVKKYDNAVILVDVLKNMSADQAAVLYLKDKIDASQYMEAVIDNKSGEEVVSDSEMAYYQIKARIKQIGAPDIFQLFIVKCINADRALMVINAWIRLQEAIRVEKNGETECTDILASIEESKIISISRYIPREFSEAYNEGAKKNSTT